MTVKEVVTSQLTMQLYDELRDTNKMKPPRRFKLPYKKTARELELKQSFKQLYDDIDEDKAYSKVFEGYYESDNKDIIFPYVIEVAIASRRQWRASNRYEPGELEFIGCVNDEPAIDSGEKYFSDGFYIWKSNNEKDKWGNPKTMTATSAKEVLHKCGFGDHIYKSKTRWPSVFIINLLTPIPGWLGSAGKTHINLDPYAKDIAEVVSWLAYKIPTCHGMGFAIDTFSVGWDRDEDQNATEYLRRFLRKRRAAIEANPYLMITDRITQSGVWYRIRPKMV